MLYFGVRLIISVIISIALFILFIRLSRACQAKHVKKQWALFLPTVCALLLTWHVLASSGPKCLDIINMLRDNYVVEQVEITQLKSFHRVKLDDGKTYYYNGFKVQLDPDKKYLISYSSWSRYIADIRGI